MSKKISVVFGFDMETDIGSWTPFYEGLVNGTPRILNLCAEKGIVVTGYWVGDAARKFPEIVREMQSAGHEIGAHSLFHETVGTPLFDIPGIFPLLPHEVEPRCRITTEIVGEITGGQPKSWRCPRLFGGTHVNNALEALGYLSDASYPMYFYGKQLYPYHSSSENWEEQGNMKLIEIPQFADLGIESLDPYGRDRDQWPLYRTASTEKLIPHIESFIRYVDERKEPETREYPTILCFYFHPWEFWDMPKPPIHFGEGAVIPDPMLIDGCGDYCLEQVGLLIDWLKDQGAQFQTAEQCAIEWNQQLSS